MKLLFNMIREKKIPITICVILSSLGAVLLIIPFALIFKIVDYYLQFGLTASAQPVLSWLGVALAAVVLRYFLIVSSFVFSISRHLICFIIFVSV